CLVGTVPPLAVGGHSGGSSRHRRGSGRENLAEAAQRGGTRRPIADGTGPRTGASAAAGRVGAAARRSPHPATSAVATVPGTRPAGPAASGTMPSAALDTEIGRASCRERVQDLGVTVLL